MKDLEAVTVKDIIAYLQQFEENTPVQNGKRGWKTRDYPKRTPAERIKAANIFVNCTDYISII